jgi:hypothetical protein
MDFAVMNLVPFNEEFLCSDLENKVIFIPHAMPNAFDIKKVTIAYGSEDPTSDVVFSLYAKEGGTVYTVSDIPVTKETSLTELDIDYTFTDVTAGYYLYLGCNTMGDDLTGRGLILTIQFGPVTEE